jgi:hypothetical protein
MIWINDRPLTDLVRDVLAIDGYLPPVVTPRAVQPLANAAGVFGTGVTVAPRGVTLRLDVRPPTLLDRATVLDSLTRRLTGLLLVRTMDVPTREWVAQCTAVRVEYYTGAFAEPVIAVECQLQAADPTRYERESRALALSTTPTEALVGTVPSAPVVYLYGACVDPVVLLRNASGDETHRLTLTGTLGANDALVIDAARHTIARYVGGVLQTGTASGNAWLTSGSFPLLAPEDAIDGAGVTVALGAASGTPTGLLLYTRGY